MVRVRTGVWQCMVCTDAEPCLFDVLADPEERVCVTVVPIHTGMTHFIKRAVLMLSVDVEHPFYIRPSHTTRKWVTHTILTSC